MFHNFEVSQNLLSVGTSVPAFLFLTSHKYFCRLFRQLNNKKITMLSVYPFLPDLLCRLNKENVSCRCQAVVRLGCISPGADPSPPLPSPARRCRCSDSSTFLFPHLLFITQDAETSVTRGLEGSGKGNCERNAAYFSPWFEHSLFFFLVCINSTSLPIRFAPPVLLVHPDDKNS